MPAIVHAALLGVVQGLTEFLPVSSSAHLILARAFFGWDAGPFALAFDVACHAGTLIAVVVYFRQEISDIVAALPRLFHPGPAQAGRHRDRRAGPALEPVKKSQVVQAFRPAVSGEPEGSQYTYTNSDFSTGSQAGRHRDGRAGPAQEPVKKSQIVQAFRPAVSGEPEGSHHTYTNSDFFTGSQAVPARDGHQGARLIWLLVVATIPAVVVGLLFGHVINDHMRTPHVAASTLAFGALGLIVAERSGDQMRSDVSLTMVEAFWLGCAQALALIPGVSRSGATLTVALLIGLRRAEAARFIFLLSIPAIAAAAANEMPELLKAGMEGNTAILFLVAVASSAIVSYATVTYFIRYLSDHSLNGFAWYRLALAGAVAIWLVR